MSASIEICACPPCGSCFDIFRTLNLPPLHASPPLLWSPLLTGSFLPLFCLYFSLSFWCEIVARLLFFCILMERICLQSVGEKPFSDGRIMGFSARRWPMIINQSNDLECIKLRVLTKSEQTEGTLEAYIERNYISLWLWRSEGSFAVLDQLLGKIIRTLIRYFRCRETSLYVCYHKKSSYQLY